MMDEKPMIIMRINLDTPDILISHEDSLNTTLSNLIHMAQDSTSPYHIDHDYILIRLLNCISRGLHNEYIPTNCPLIFDSWSCWNSTPLNSVQFEQCPNFVNMGFKSDRLAEKLCTEDGTWWVHPDSNR